MFFGELRACGVDRFVFLVVDMFCYAASFARLRVCSVLIFYISKIHYIN